MHAFIHAAAAAGSTKNHATTIFSYFAKTLAFLMSLLSVLGPFGPDRLLGLVGLTS